MRRLTVIQLLPALESGGVERSTLEIASALVRDGHRAIVVSAGGRLLPALQQAGAEHITLDIGRKSLLSLRHLPALRALFAREGADIVHARSRLPAWLGLKAVQGIAEAQRPRFITTVHGLNSPGRYSAVMARGERVICVSDTVRRYVLQHYPDTKADFLRVIPRGIDPDQFPRVPVPDRTAPGQRSHRRESRLAARRPGRDQACGPVYPKGAARPPQARARLALACSARGSAQRYRGRAGAADRQPEFRRYHRCACGAA